MSAIRTAATGAEVEALAKELAAVDTIAIDVESDGLFAYRAKVCLIQIAWGSDVAIVDTLATSLAPLAGVLGNGGPVKVLHDLAFDARILAEANITLGRVSDTAVAARLLGRTTTGLANVLLDELGITLDKTMQHHDWRLRPIDEKMLSYLVSDVAHLVRLDTALRAKVDALGIANEVAEETTYRLNGAIRAVESPDRRPAYLRIKGIERANTPELAILRHLAIAREREGEKRDVPVHRVASHDALLAIARSRPGTLSQVRRVRGIHGDDAFLESLVEGVKAGLDDPAVPEEDMEWLRKPRAATVFLKERREREQRLTAWRRAEAKKRNVDEQVVLPGHCLQEIAEQAPRDTAALASVQGLGAFRIARDGDAILRAILTPLPSAPQ